MGGLSLKEILVAEDDDCSMGTSSYYGSSERSSITSSIYKVHVENGRRYQTTREDEYWMPSDEKQFQSMHGAHIMTLILDSQEKNPLFRSPIPEYARILDIGSGTGDWIRDVGDRYPSAQVHGIDLSPSPESWNPQNVQLSIDDALKPWVCEQPFDLIHLRWLYGAFTDNQWMDVYKKAYENLEPGGWIEQVEPDINFRSDDGTLPADSLMAQWGPLFIDCCARAGKPLDTADTFKSRIERAGFRGIQEKVYKVPFGSWVKNPMLKEAGAINKAQLTQGMEGYAMFLLTHFGTPDPWRPEEVYAYLAKVREEMNNSGWHIYLIMRRVWAQKSLGDETMKL